MRICIERATGKLIEAQEKATPGTLIRNALQRYAAKDIEEKVVSDAEYQALRAAMRATEFTAEEKRRAAYPTVGDQLDDLFKQNQFSAEMAAKIQAVKDQFPMTAK